MAILNPNAVILQPLRLTATNYVEMYIPIILDLLSILMLSCAAIS